MFCGWAGSQVVGVRHHAQIKQFLGIFQLAMLSLKHHYFGPTTQLNSKLLVIKSVESKLYKYAHDFFNNHLVIAQFHHKVRLILFEHPVKFAQFEHCA